MYRALVRNLLQPGSLLVAQVSFKGHGTFDPVHKSVGLVRAFLAIGSVNATLAQMHFYSLQRPILSSRVKRHSHGNTTAQRAEN
jgi:hypothetical protein